jgi:hypothetical protein
VVGTSAKDERYKNIETSLQLYTKRKARKCPPKKEMDSGSQNRKCLFLSRREDVCNDDNDFTTLI